MTDTIYIGYSDACLCTHCLHVSIYDIISLKQWHVSGYCHPSRPEPNRLLFLADYLSILQFSFPNYSFKVCQWRIYTQAHLVLCPGKINFVSPRVRFIQSKALVWHRVNSCHCSTAVLLLLLLLQIELIQPVVVVWNTASYCKSRSWLLKIM